jgi:hypothetical protein
MPSDELADRPPSGGSPDSETPRPGTVESPWADDLLGVGAEVEGARCVICGAPSTTSSADHLPTRTSDTALRTLPDPPPPVQLCDEHWAQYRSDWLLLGWCVDHYGEALRFCPIHRQEIQPL